MSKDIFLLILQKKLKLGTKMNKIISFDALRFFCSIFIVLHHVCVSFGGTYFRCAHLAVEFFLILSGFLLAQTHERLEKEKIPPEKKCLHYVLSRVKRLYPEYIFALFLTILIQDTLGSYTSLQPLGLNLFMIAGMGGINNVIW